MKNNFKIASLFAGSSHWALIVVRGWVVYQISDSSMYVGLVTFAAMIPMVLVNGMNGIGTGFSTNIPCFNPVDICHNILLILLYCRVANRNSFIY